jgi:hypothetical protein
LTEAARKERLAKELAANADTCDTYRKARPNASGPLEGMFGNTLLAASAD